MLRERVLSALVLIPLVIGAAAAGGYLFAALLLVAALLAAHEYGQLLHLPELPALHVSLLALVALLLADATWPALGLIRVLIVLAPLTTLAMLIVYQNRPGSIEKWGLALGGALYLGAAAGAFIRLRATNQGLPWLVLALASTWACDTGAYFVGRAWGRHRLAATISPKKSWEGVAGGLVVGVAVVLAIGLGFVTGFLWWHGLLLGVLVVAAAVVGDLAESVIKRQVGAKDSGQLIPGHGGVLDRIDSLLYVVPVVYAFARLVGLD